MKSQNESADLAELIRNQVEARANGCFVIAGIERPLPGSLNDARAKYQALNPSRRLYHVFGETTGKEYWAFLFATTSYHEQPTDALYDCEGCNHYSHEGDFKGKRLCSACRADYQGDLHAQAAAIRGELDQAAAEFMEGMTARPTNPLDALLASGAIGVEEVARLGSVGLEAPQYSPAGGEDFDARR